MLPMTEEVYQCFAEILRRRKSPRVETMIDGHGNFLYYDKNGNPLVAMHWEHYFGRAVNKYNRIYRYQLPTITPHVCRHTYCTNMALSGISAKTLQYLMGHSDISITLNVYTHIKFDNAQKEVELVQQRQQKEMENVRKELEQVGAIRPKIILFKNEA